MAAPPIRQDTRELPGKRCMDDSQTSEIFSIFLDRSVHGQELGVVIDFQKTKLRIRTINDGMVKTFNEMSDSTSRINPGDEILKVNDIAGDAKRMAQLCKTDSKLRLLLCKGTKNPESKRPKISPVDMNPKPSRGLYDFLPASNPKNDALAKQEAAKKEGVNQCTVYAANRCVFLDIDGVLRPLQGSTFNVSTINIDGISIPLAGCGSDFLPSAMAALTHIIQETGARIVLSSEWRRHPTLREGVQEALRLANLPALAGDTTTDVLREMGTGDPVYSFAERRVKEIGMYLKENPSVDSWVILDDIDLAVADSRKSSCKPMIGDNFVRTDEEIGLTVELARRAIDVLKRKIS